MASDNTARKSRRSAIRRKPELKVANKPVHPGDSWADEVLSVLFFVLTVFLLGSFLSFKYFASLPLQSEVEGSPSDIRNLMGPIGHMLSLIMSRLFGWCALVLALWTGWCAMYFWNYERIKKNTRPAAVWLVVLGLVGVLFFSCTVTFTLGGKAAGGVLGSFAGEPLEVLLGKPGALLLGGMFLLASVALATRTSLLVILGWFGRGGGRLLHFFSVVLPLGVGRGLTCFLRWAAGLIFYRAGDDDPEEDDLPKPRRRRNSVSPFVIGAADEKAPEKAGTARNGSSPEDREKKEDLYRVVVNRPDAEARKNARKAARERKAARGRDALKGRSGCQESSFYRAPDFSLLGRNDKPVEAEDDEELRHKSRVIENKLADFGIAGRVTHVHPGPVITLFEFEPAPGVKVGRIAALSDDLAMSLRASSIRILAPIPRRGTVGIEVPNKHREVVRLRDLLESEAFSSAESVLSVPLGKDTAGAPVVGDIAVMPHLLIAGATGTGKSVWINAFLISLLYRASPEEVGLILIDPKMLELSCYEGIPHLKVPVVTVHRQARAVLQWAITEMERRYRLMKRLGVRNLDSYNRYVAGEDAGAKRDSAAMEDLIRLEEEDVVSEGLVEAEAEEPADDEDEVSISEELRPLSRIVIVIDELADLMLSVGRDIEELITRLAQKARASGIHLIIATQRPSVDVITGLIKANFPARLSFRVTSRIDSRTILDGGGAEKLLGRGDFLFMQPGGESLRRMHGAFVSDDEVTRVVQSIRASNERPQYDERMMALMDKALEEESEEGGGGGGQDAEGMDYDPLYDKAVEIVVGKGHASTSMIQRVFRIGYNRAARMIETMEREGVIGPMDGAKPREVLVGAVDRDEEN